MKALKIVLCWAGLLTAANAAELLWQDFDSAPTGSVAALPGWSRAAWLGGITGRVDDINYSWSDPQILELPWNATASSAVYTNFNSTYTTNEHPVIRCSAKLVTLNTNAYFQLGLRNSSTGARLAFEGTNGYGTFGFLYRDSVFIPLVNDRFVDVTFFYNRSNNHYRLDYDFTNRLAWTTNGESGVRVTNFNQFVVARPGGTAGTTGSFLVDDVSVETFPPHVWAWWRCTADPNRRVVEQLGSFASALRDPFSDADRPGSCDPVWDGTADFHNAGSTRQLAADTAAAAVPLPPTTNWTLETVVRMDPAVANTAFFDWSTNFGHNATSAWIQVGYNSNGYVYVNLRDARQDNVSYINLALRDYAPNGRWQHLAVVKSNAQLALYVDYQLVTNRTLVPPATGAYAFDTASRATLGRALNNSNVADANTLFDEIRFSAKALAPAEFLQPGQPLIVDIDNSPTNTPWQLTMKGILGKSYRVETSPSIGTNANWQYATNRVADYTFNYIDIPGTVPKTNFVRILRTN